MSATQPQVQMGYPDFWPVILRRYGRFFDLAQQLGPTINDVFSQSHTEPLHKVCRQLSKMVANSVGAVLLLGVNGYGVDAIKIVRSMFEAAVTVRYLCKHPDEFVDYSDFHFIVAMKRYRYMEKYAPEQLKNVTQDALKHGKQGFAAVVPKFTTDGRVRGRWSKKPFSQLCADIDLEEHYLTFYEFASNITHANISGLMAQADPQPGVMDVDIAPSEQFVDMALRTAHFAFVMSISDYITLARPEKQGIADRIDREFVAVWKD